MRGRAIAGLVVLGVLSSSPRASAEERPQLRYSLSADLAITGVGGAAWITSELLKGHLAPDACRWCEPPGLDVAVRDALVWEDTRAADTASYVTGFALSPLLAFGLDAALVLGSGGRGEEVGIDALVILESIVVAVDLNQAVKLAVGRERPFVHALSRDAKGRTSQPSDNDLSFFSGHTTLAFAAAASAGTIASLKHDDAAPWVWAGGLTLAAATGYLRIGADRHWFTDVLTGALVGSAVGVLVPYLHRPCTGTCLEGVSAGPLTGGASFALRGAW